MPGYKNSFKNTATKNLLLNSYFAIFANAFIKKNNIDIKKNEFTSTHHYLHSAISINFYKKNLNRERLFFLNKNKKNDSGDIRSLCTVNSNIGYGKLTWYLVFKSLTQNRFLLNYKEYKEYFSKNLFLKYEHSLLKYEQSYNRWNFFALKYTKIIKHLYLSKFLKRRFSGYVFKFAAPRLIKKKNKPNKYLCKTL